MNAELLVYGAALLAWGLYLLGWGLSRPKQPRLRPMDGEWLRKNRGENNA